MTNAFQSRAGCPLPDVPTIPHDLVQGCIIPPPPDPFWEGMEFPPILIPPPPGCAEIEVTGGIEFVGEGGIPSFAASFEGRDGDNCFPTLDFNITVPCACTSLEAESSGKYGDAGPKLDVVVTNIATPSSASSTCACGISMDFDLEIPCVCTSMEASVESKFKEGAPSLGVEVTNIKEESSSACGCGISLDFDLSVPCVCTRITVESANISVGTPSIDVSFTPDTTSTESKCDCDVKFNMSITVPSVEAGCKSISAGSTVNPNPGGYGTLTVDSFENPAGKPCTLNLEMTLDIPQPCQSIAAGSTVNPNPGGYGTLTVDSFEVDPADSCKLDLTMTLDVPQPCQSIDGGAVTGTVSPGGTVSGAVTAVVGEPCKLEVADLAITVSGFLGSITAGTTGTGECVGGIRVDGGGQVVLELIECAAVAAKYC